MVSMTTDGWDPRWSSAQCVLRRVAPSTSDTDAFDEFRTPGQPNDRLGLAGPGAGCGYESGRSSHPVNVAARIRIRLRREATFYVRFGIAAEFPHVGFSSWLAHDHAAAGFIRDRDRLNRHRPMLTRRVMAW